MTRLAFTDERYNKPKIAKQYVEFETLHTYEAKCNRGFLKGSSDARFTQVDMILYSLNENL